MYLMRLMNGSYMNEDGTMRLREMATSECISGGTCSHDPFLNFGYYPLAMGRTIDRTCR